MMISKDSKKGSSLSSLAEINVTPFVDVMLVLLVIFMVSAPLMQQGMQVDLPEASTGNLETNPDEVTLIVDKNRNFEINGSKIKKGQLESTLKAIAESKPKVQVYVQADQTLPYGYIAKVVAVVRQANIERVGLVTNPSSRKIKL